MEIYSQKKEPFARYIILGVLAVLFLLDAVLVITGKTAGIDDPVIKAIGGMRGSFLNLIVIGITYLADPKVIIGICLVLCILPTRWKFGFPLTFSVGFASGVHKVLKMFIHRARPDELPWLVEEDGYSFPSGHSNAGLVFYLFLMILLYRYFTINGNRGLARLVLIGFPILVFLMGTSRIYVGVHYPTDVLGGWLLGACLLILLVTVYDMLYPTKWRITAEQPGWEMMRKTRPWKKPVNKESEMIEFPKNRSPWRKPVVQRKHTKGDGSNADE